MKSVPSGALVIDQVSGYQIITPAYLAYQNITEDKKDRDGCYLVAPIKIYWKSGAYVEYGSGLRLCGQSPNYEIVVHRPDAPGIEQDIAVANLQQQQLSAQQAALAAQQAYQSQAAQENLAATSGYLLGCALAGGCRSSQPAYSPPRLSSPTITTPNVSVLSFPSSTITPDGTYVSGPTATLCPDGTYAGGNRCILAPDGTYVAN